MDIILLAAIAIYIFIKLRAELGKIDEDQKRDAIKNFIKEQTQSQNAGIAGKQAVIAASSENTVAAEPDISAIDVKNKAILDQIDPQIREDFINVLQNARITPVHFIDGAVKAFEMIIDGFASGDLSKVKPLLAEKLYSQFEEVIAQRKTMGQTLITKIIAINQNSVISANMIQNFAQVTIKFASKQINYLTNSGGEIIDGSKDEVNEVADIWTFKKDCQTENPNWFISATSGQ